VIKELLFERGVIVSYETIRRRCDRFGADFACRVNAARRALGSTWHLDEVFIELEIPPQKRRDKAAAKRFFKRVLAACPGGRTRS
jgi:putative transposase